MNAFTGFEKPRSNYYRLPNNWFDMWQHSRRSLAKGKRPARIIALLKVVEYVIKHTWGWSNFEECIRLSRSDIMHGRCGRKGNRLDIGTGLGSEATLTRGIDAAIGLNMLEQVKIDDDAGRQERHYRPHLQPDDRDDVPYRPDVGFDYPDANYFIVPKYWTDISAKLGSETLILTIEYFFRHTWGWQEPNEQKIRWLYADDIANGRAYRTSSIRNERYDNGIGYTDRQVRNALDQGVKEGLLIWCHDDAMIRRYALRMSWMDNVESNGFYDPDPLPFSDHVPGQNGWGWLYDIPAEKGVGGTEKTVEGSEKDSVFAEKTVEGQEKLVGVSEKAVEGTEKTVGGSEKAVDRSYKDTSIKTPTQDTPIKTPSSTHLAPARKLDDGDVGMVIFCPELESELLGPPERMTISQAAERILTDDGAWFWSEDDLQNPDRAERDGFTCNEIKRQLDLDETMFGEDRVIVSDQDKVEVVTVILAARKMTSVTKTAQFDVCHSLWDWLDLPHPDDACAYRSEIRRQRLRQYQCQAEAWGDPDLITALSIIHILPPDARSLIKNYGRSKVSECLKSLRKNRAPIRNLAGLLISKLQKDLNVPSIYDFCA